MGWLAGGVEFPTRYTKRRCKASSSDIKTLTPALSHGERENIASAAVAWN